MADDYVSEHDRTMGKAIFGMTFLASGISVAVLWALEGRLPNSAVWTILLVFLLVVSAFALGCVIYLIWKSFLDTWTRTAAIGFAALHLIMSPLASFAIVWLLFRLLSARVFS